LLNSLYKEKIYEIKKRPKDKRLAVLCANVSDIEKIALVNDDARKLIENYMPGGLTVILKSKPEFRSEYISETVAVRIPNHELALRILSINGPMATSSVNISGSKPMNDYLEIVKRFSDEVLYVYPNALESSKVSSTIVDLSTDECILIREGTIKFSEIVNFLNK
jgi:L-threonylcarbamoyladenylate synthase